MAVPNTTDTPMSYESLIAAIVEVGADSRMGSAAAVSRHHTLGNWLIGAYIVEFEQSGADRPDSMRGLSADGFLEIGLDASAYGTHTLRRTSDKRIEGPNVTTVKEALRRAA